MALKAGQLVEHLGPEEVVGLVFRSGQGDADLLETADLPGEEAHILDHPGPVGKVADRVGVVLDLGKGEHGKGQDRNQQDQDGGTIAEHPAAQIGQDPGQGAFDHLLALPVLWRPQAVEHRGKEEQGKQSASEDPEARRDGELPGLLHAHRKQAQQSGDGGHGGQQDGLVHVGDRPADPAAVFAVLFGFPVVLIEDVDAVGASQGQHQRWDDHAHQGQVEADQGHETQAPDRADTHHQDRQGHGPFGAKAQVEDDQHHHTGQNQQGGQVPQQVGLGGVHEGDRAGDVDRIVGLEVCQNAVDFPHQLGVVLRAFGREEGKEHGPIPGNHEVHCKGGGEQILPEDRQFLRRLRVPAARGHRLEGEPASLFLK